MRAVVTGAARGIGATIADRLATDGFDVVRLDLHESEGVRACDVTDASAVEATAAEIGDIDVLVNNAGVWPFGALEDVSSAQFRAAIDVNLMGTFHCTQAFGRPMLDRDPGTRGGTPAIVNIVSIAAHSANPSVGGYSSSKSAVLALTRQTALEWGPRGVRCNAVGPGLVPTPGTGAVYDDDRVSAARASAVPLRRLGEPEDISGVVSFLVSPDAAYVTGQVLYVDGGLSQGLMTLLPRPDDLPGPKLAPGHDA